MLLYVFISGGSKRFLYTGPNKRRPGVTEDDDEEEIHWNFVNTLTHPGAQPYRPPDTGEITALLFICLLFSDYSLRKIYIEDNNAGRIMMLPGYLS